MNFSKKAKLSRVLSLILAVVMVCSLFSGCKKEEDSSSTESTPSGLNINLSDSTQPTETQQSTEPTEAAGINATVTNTLNVRSNPDDESPIIYTLKAGDRIEIRDRRTVMDAQWGYTPSVPDGGWVMMNYVEMDASEEPIDTPSDTSTPTEPNTQTPGTTVNLKGVCTVNGLNIRSEASTDSAIKGSYNKGDIVTILETKSGWGRTDEGWVKLEYIDTTSSNTNNNNTTGNQNTNNNSGNTAVEGNGSTKVIAKGVVKAGELNIRSKATTDSDKVGTLKYGARVEILEKSGSWGRTSKGWIHLDYVYQDGTTGKNTDNGTVTGNGLRIRSGPGTNYDSIGSYSSGDRVKILEQFTYGNTTWGCTNKGWISLSYVDLDSDTSDGSNGSASADGRTGTITAGELNIREGAGIGYDVIGSYERGDVVTIIETKNGWGRTNKGWISLNYVEFDEDSSRTATVAATELRIREGAGTEYDVVGSYEEGDRITILETRSGWGRTNQGWVSLDYIDFD